MGVQLSLSAAQQVERIIESEQHGLFLRVYIEGGGCSGFQYRFELADEQEPDDTLVFAEGSEVGLVVDALSLQYLDGATINYIDDLMGSRFTVDNPNASTTCGCGSSFAI